MDASPALKPPPPSEARVLVDQDYLVVIGELYVQVRILQNTLARQSSSAAASPNGTVGDAVREQ